MLLKRSVSRQIVSGGKGSHPQRKPKRFISTLDGKEIHKLPEKREFFGHIRIDASVSSGQK